MTQRTNGRSGDGLHNGLHKEPKGQLIIIGGAEDKEDGSAILNEVARRARQHRKPLAVVTIATQLPQEMAAEYSELFHGLGVKDVDVLDVRTREEAYEAEKVAVIERAGTLFFTGGDQLRITSQIGDSPIYRHAYKLFMEGGTVAGTSAGAAAMCETMLIGGPSDESHRLSSIEMASGLGLLSDVVIDTHFAERGRIGRLLGAVAQNPRNLGIGIDEDTAIVVDGNRTFSVIGSGAVYVVDGAGITFSNLSDESRSDVLCLHDVKLHVLCYGSKFSIEERHPIKEPVPAGVS